MIPHEGTEKNTMQRRKKSSGELPLGGLLQPRRLGAIAAVTETVSLAWESVRAAYSPTPKRFPFPAPSEHVLCSARTTITSKKRDREDVLGITLGPASGQHPRGAADMSAS